MTTEAPWMRVYTRDWLARTGGLTPSDKGILSDLNAIMHERGEPVVFNEKLLAARCRATPKSFAKSVKTLIEAGLVSVEHGFLWSEDMQRQIEFQEKKSVNGKSAAKKRHDKTKQNQSSTPANAMPYQMQISDTEGQPPSGSDPSDTHSVDDLDAREATEAASFTRLDGAPDASGDFAYWCDQAGIDAVEIDLNDAPDIKIIAADDENQPPPLTVTDRYFSGLTHDEALSVEPSERDRVVAELLSGLSLPPALERRVSELLYAGHLTRRKFEQIASISGMEERYVGTR